MPTVSRRVFFAATSASVLVPAAAAPAAVLARMEGGLPGGWPTAEPKLAREIVGKSHANIDAVRDILKDRPALAKAAWDWGFGDWESALGAASHMGRRDIAELLIAHGARPNLFTFAMMDQVDVVRAACEANPGIQKTPGPHGITLYQHARFGKADSVMKYLKELGDANAAQANLPIDEAAAEPFLGEYTPEGAPGVVLRVGFHERRKVLTLQRDDRQARFLLRVGDHAFAPGGAAGVRIEFEMKDGIARALTIRDGDVLTATRQVLR